MPLCEYSDSEDSEANFCEVVLAPNRPFQASFSGQLRRSPRQSPQSTSSHSGYTSPVESPALSSQMPALSRFVEYAFTIITSSAAAERVFSVIKRSFDTCQKGALEDYVFLSTIMQYNKVKGVQDLRII